VAYLLSHHAWGHGYATEAAHAALSFGFKQAGLNAIIGLVHPENTASIRVLEKCGLTSLDRKVYWGLEMLRYRMESYKLNPS
jgi:RimJ/RimL family protein N-acetyltransferase